MEIRNNEILEKNKAALKQTKTNKNQKQQQKSTPVKFCIWSYNSILGPKKKELKLIFA